MLKKKQSQQKESYDELMQNALDDDDVVITAASFSQLAGEAAGEVCQSPSAAIKDANANTGGNGAASSEDPDLDTRVIQQEMQNAMSRSLLAALLILLVVCVCIVYSAANNRVTSFQETTSASGDDYSVDTSYALYFGWRSLKYKYSVDYTSSSYSYSDGSPYHDVCSQYKGTNSSGSTASAIGDDLCALEERGEIFMGLQMTALASGILAILGIFVVYCQMRDTNRIVDQRQDFQLSHKCIMLWQDKQLVKLFYRVTLGLVLLMFLCLLGAWLVWQVDSPIDDLIKLIEDQYDTDTDTDTDTTDDTSYKIGDQEWCFWMYSTTVSAVAAIGVLGLLLNHNKEGRHGCRCSPNGSRNGLQSVGSDS